MRRKSHVDIFAEVPNRGEYDECPMVDVGHEPQLHLSKNSLAQPFFLICENDCVIVQLAGSARLEFQGSSVNYFDLELGDFAYVPGGTPHRLLPTSQSIHLRYKAEFPGLEACAWYSSTGEEISRIAWDCAVELPQEGYLRACQTFNRDRNLRTRRKTGEELPLIDLSPFNWTAVAQSVREAEQTERDRLAKRGAPVPTAERRADLTFRPPPTKTEPMRVNVYEFARIATCQLNPMFPYHGPGCIVPCTSMHDTMTMGPMGYFIHENTVDEVVLCFGAHSNFRAPGKVFIGPMIHGVGEKPGPGAFSGEKHGVGEKKGSDEFPDMFAVMVITQRQSVGIPQREAWSVVCENCETELFRHPYDAHEIADAIEADDPVLLGLPTISHSSWAVERFNEDQSLRACGKCGHLNPKFPEPYWSWTQYRHRTRVAVRCREILADAAAKSLAASSVQA
jgi:3-hydroxyanthranilate 3,4-dioxygenase